MPQLRFRLIGTWHPLVLGDRSSDELVRTLVHDVAGTRDQDATTRARLRGEFERVVAETVAGGADAVFVGTELSGSPIAVTLIVQTPDGLRMSPAVGTSPSAVLETLAESFRRLGRIGADETPHIVTAADAAALRTHRLREETVEEAGERITLRTLVAEYWFAVPGTKQIVLATFITPMGEIQNVMLTFFDAIVRAASFAPVDASAA